MLETMTTAPSRRAAICGMTRLQSPSTCLTFVSMILS